MNLDLFVHLWARDRVMSEQVGEMNHLLEVPLITKGYLCMDRKTLLEYFYDASAPVWNFCTCRIDSEKEVQMPRKRATELFAEEEELSWTH